MKKRNKYSAIAVEADGRRFDSKREYRRWCELQLLQRAGEITDLEHQVPVVLEGRDGPILYEGGRKAKYIADFRYFDIRSSEWVLEDSKGAKTPIYLLKKAILKSQGVQIRES